MEKIISNELVLTIIGNNGTAAQLNYQNTAMTQMLADVLGIREFGVHAVTDEEVKGGDSLRVNDFPINTTGITLKDYLGNAITGYTFELDDYTVGRGDTVSVIGASGVETELPYDEVYVSYTAGYILRDTLKVTDYSTLIGQTMTVTNNASGVEQTYTFSATSGAMKIKAETSNDVTAANIADALGGTHSTDTMTAPLDYTITFTGTGATLTNTNLPTNFKTCVAILIKASIENINQVGNVASYSIGGKSVNYKGDTTTQVFKDIISNFLGIYIKAQVLC